MTHLTIAHAPTPRPLTRTKLERRMLRRLAGVFACALLAGCFDPGSDEGGETSASSTGTGSGSEAGDASESGTTTPASGGTSGGEMSGGESTGSMPDDTGGDTGSTSGTTSGSTSGSESGDDPGSESGEGTTGCTQSDWYPDADDDGFGDPAGPVVSACEAPGGYVDNGDDCDDSTEFRSPGVVEICDGLDNDCDTALDEWSALNPSCGECEMQFQAGSAYSYCLGTDNASDAEAECALKGASLVKIESQLENDFITAAATELGLGDFRIGLELDGETWVWTDGAVMTFDAWRPGSPDSGDDCAELDTDDSGLWNDIPCSTTTSTIGWICEGTP